MPKVYLDEIEAVLGSGTCSSLSTDATESKSINDSLTSYINTSQSTLKGEQWDKSRAKMETFNAALQTRMELAEKLGSAIQQALSLLKDYLGEDAMLDTDQLPEYQQKRQECQACIEKLNAMLTRTVTHTDANGQPYTTQELVYDTAAVQAQINLANETLKELDRIIQKIEGLEAVYNQALGILEGAFAELTPFQNQVTSITPSGIFTYKPAPAGTTTTTGGTTTTTTTTDTKTDTGTESGSTSGDSKNDSPKGSTSGFSLTLQPKAGDQPKTEATPATT